MTDSNPAEAFKKLDLQDRLTAGGAAVLAVMLLLPWYSLELPKEARHLMGDVGSIKWTQEWQGKLALVLAVLSAAWLVIPGLRAAVAPKLPPNAVSFMTLILAGGAFLFGPFWFFLDAPDLPSFSTEMGISGGKTFWWVLALLAGLASAGAAAWKLFGMPKKSMP